MHEHIKEFPIEENYTIQEDQFVPEILPYANKDETYDQSQTGENDQKELENGTDGVINEEQNRQENVTDEVTEEEQNYEEMLNLISDLENAQIHSSTKEMWIDGQRNLTHEFKTDLISKITRILFYLFKSLKSDVVNTQHLMQFEDVNVKFEQKPVGLGFAEPVKLELNTDNFGNLVTTLQNVTNKMADIEISLANFYDSFSFDESNESNAVNLAVNSLRVATKQLASDSAIIRQNITDAKLDASDINQSIVCIRNIVDTYDKNVKSSLNQITEAYNLIRTNTEFVNENFSSYIEKVETNSDKINDLYVEIEKAYESFKVQHMFVSNDLKQVSQYVEKLEEGLKIKNVQDQVFKDKIFKLFLYFGISIIILIIIKMILGVVA